MRAERSLRGVVCPRGVGRGACGAFAHDSTLPGERREHHPALPWSVPSIGPDVALLYGAARGLEKGQLHPRAVGAYNLLHRFWGPLLLATLASFDVLALGFLIGALAWAFHVALDRALGYGLRTRDGFQRS